MIANTGVKYLGKQNLMMRSRFFRVFGICLLFLGAILTPVSAQNKCFSEDDKTKIINSISNPQKSENLKNIKSELVKLDSNRKSLESDIISDKNKEELLVKRKQLLRDGLIRLCAIHKEYGWLNKDSIGNDGVSATMSLILGSDLVDIQREYLPILVAAAAKHEVNREDIANLIDAVRIKSGMAQLFGTQAGLIDDLVYLQPLENEALVDQWRKEYGLPPLNDFMRKLEVDYQTLVIKRRKVATKLTVPKADQKVLGLEDKDDEVIKVSTNVVNVDVRILDKNSSPLRGSNLGAQDFSLFEDNQEQKITFFEKNAQPIDFYLILDLSGSTARIRDIIWKTAANLVKTSKPGDRVAVLTHLDKQLRTLSELTTDQNKILSNLSRFNGLGSSSLWDAVNESYGFIERQNVKDRRPVIVLITDGIEEGSKLAFGNLLGRVKEKDAIIFPIQVTTDFLIEDPTASKRRLNIANRALSLLAEESGGEYFKLKNDDELLTIPERVTNALGDIYSLGFESSNTNFDGAWRQLTVKVINHNDFKVRARTGYYAKP
jgi:Ca-activated chloride channel family protein